MARLRSDENKNQKLTRRILSRYPARLTRTLVDRCCCTRSVISRLQRPVSWESTTSASKTCQSNFQFPSITDRSIPSSIVARYNASHPCLVRTPSYARVQRSRNFRRKNDPARCSGSIKVSRQRDYLVKQPRSHDDATARRGRRGGNVRARTRVLTHRYRHRHARGDCQSIRASRPGIRQLGVVTFPEQSPHHPGPRVVPLQPLRADLPPRSSTRSFSSPRATTRIKRHHVLDPSNAICQTMGTRGANSISPMPKREKNSKATSKLVLDWPSRAVQTRPPNRGPG